MIQAVLVFQRGECLPGKDQSLTTEAGFGWHGYQEKNERRAADKVLREFIADQLRLVKQDLEKLQMMVVEYNRSKTWETF